MPLDESNPPLGVACSLTVYDGAVEFDTVSEKDDLLCLTVLF